MTRNEILRRLPNASESTIRKNLSLGDSGPVAVVECNPGDAPLAAAEVQKAATGRFLVRVTAYRKRLLDEDNLCEKYHVDCLRYCGVLPGDEPQKVKIEVHQVKSKVEKTVIEVYE